MELDLFLDSYLPLLDQSLLNTDDGNIKIPVFTSLQLHDLFQSTSTYLLQVPTLINVEGSVVIIGDIHGNVRDLIRIIRKNGLPEDFTYVFLGDYVDRGDFSIEVLTLLATLQMNYTKNIVLLRGNHETKKVSSMYGLKREIDMCYGECSLFDTITSMFDNLSLAAIVNNENFCVHGGISKHLQDVSQIADIEKPIAFEDDKSKRGKSINDLIWSDPSDTFTGFSDNLTRGKGTTCFGYLAVVEFLKKNSLKAIIRGHSFVPEGVKCQWKGLLYTVFSSSGYCTKTKNKAGYLRIEQGSIRAGALEFIPQLVRSNAKFSFFGNCKTISDLHSCHVMGPIVVNRYWSTRRANAQPNPLHLSDFPPLVSKSCIVADASFDLVRLAINRKKIRINKALGSPTKQRCCSINLS